MTIQPTYRIVFSESLRKALADQNTVRGPLREALTKSALVVEGRAKEKAPVDTGRLRASITHRVEDTRAIVGSKVSYAPHVEFGTRPHWPPQGALQPWARRHGFPAGPAGDFMIRRLIAKRGTRPRPYLVPALEESKDDIQRFFDEAGRKIVLRWQSRG